MTELAYPDVLGQHFVLMLCKGIHFTFFPMHFSDVCLRSILDYLSAVESFSPFFPFVGFQGHIPSNLGRLVNLAQLDLAFNRLSGTIPSEVRASPCRGDDCICSNVSLIQRGRILTTITALICRFIFSMPWSVLRFD